MSLDVKSPDSVSGARPAPPIDVLVHRAADLRPVIAERAARTEADRRVSSETMSLLADNGLLTMCKPARFGGYEYGPSAMIKIGYELGQACGSTAWCAALSNCNSWFGSYWSLQAQQEVWADDNVDNLIAAPLAPTGKCEPVDGGYNLWGRWPFASNCDNSQWAIISAVIPESGAGPSGPGWFLTPMSTLRIDQDSWHMAGMQGTGSKVLYADEPVFVPAHRLVRLSDVVALTTPGRDIDANVMSRFGWTTFGAAALIGPILGMARGALEWFVDNMRSKVRPGAASSAADNAFVQERAGRSAAALDAVLGLVLDDVEEAETAIFAGERLEQSQRVRIRRDFGFASQQAVEVVNYLYGAAGASAAEVNRPIQRFWRDVNAAAGHVSLDSPSILAMTGQLMFGLTPTGAH